MTIADMRKRCGCGLVILENEEECFACWLEKKRAEVSKKEEPPTSSRSGVAVGSLHSFTKTTRHVYRPIWIKREFMKCDESYREIRSKYKNKLTSCIKCGHKYEDGEMMALACFEKRGNKTLCQHCADSLGCA